jgi:hypothetical protein
MSFEAELCRLRKDVHALAHVLIVIPLTLRRLLRYTASLVEAVK